MSNMCLPHQSDTSPYGYLFTPYPLLWLDNIHICFYSRMFYMHYKWSVVQQHVVTMRHCAAMLSETDCRSCDGAHDVKRWKNRKRCIITGRCMLLLHLSTHREPRVQVWERGSEGHCHWHMKCKTYLWGFTPCLDPSAHHFTHPHIGINDAIQQRTTEKKDEIIVWPQWAREANGWGTIYS